MAKTNYKTIDDYHRAHSGETLERIQAIREIINGTVPEAEEVISYQIPCFRYRGEALLYYSAYPKHVSISYPFSAEFWSQFKADLAGLKTSKSAIQFPSDRPLPKPLIKRIVTFRKRENEAETAGGRR